MFLFGILSYQERSLFTILVTSVFILILFLKIRKKEHKFFKRGTVYILLLLVCFFLGMARSVFFETAKNQRRIQLSDGENILCSGRILHKEKKNDKTLYTLQKPSLKGKSTSFHHAILYLDSGDYYIGETILVYGTVKLPKEAENYGNFDQKSYYDALDTDFLFYGKEVRAATGTKNPVRCALGRFSETMEETYRALLPEKEAGLLSTMVLGNRGSLDPEIKELYQNAGISHILAISGLHISMIGMLLYRILRKCRMPFLASAFAGGTLILLYAEMTGRSPSAFRAAFMFTLSVFAPAVKRSYDLWTGLALSALLLLAENPEVTRNTGFVFSYLAVLGIASAGKSIEEMLHQTRVKKEKKGLKEDLKNIIKSRMKGFLETASVSFGVQLTTLPLVMQVYYSFPLYAVVLNLLVLPLTGILLITGLIGGIFGSLALYGSILPVWLSEKILFIPKLIFGLYERLCRAFLSIPGSTLVCGKPEEWMVILYFLFLLSCFFLFYKKRKKFAALLPLGGLVLLGFLSGHRGFELSMLSVGQGDGLYLQADSGEHCMIDGGSSDVKGLYKYRIEPFLRAMGADHVDWWFVSHADNDHISALMEAMEEGLIIRHLVFSKYILQDEAFHELKGMAKDRGIPVHMMEPGEKLALGDTKITCLFPAESDQKGDRNAQSLVLRVDEKDFSALLTGDISSEEEKAMLERGILENVDFYKAAHHGSRYSNSEEFLEALSPRICGISCALKNRYGHPGEEALHNIEETGAALFETRFCGQVRLRLQKYNITVWTAHNTKEAQGL